MHTEPSRHPNNPEIRYEKTDAHVRPLYQFLFWISVITLLTAGIAMAILKGLESWRDKASTRPAMAEAPEAMQPPAPRLQIQEPKDLAVFRKEEKEILSTYGIVDRDKGIYRIPIEEAMKLTLERGLPTVDDAAPAAGRSVVAGAAPAREPAKAAHQ
ncbi:MAG: hypothetical protein K1Y01_09920 [Vicinamibacteria bacterium]|nr:hypothetical protein [Vicinamibacteria bacterium]